MSQQTQINRVAEHYYPKFLKTFPNVKTLAAADWKTLYPVWDGLGYYQRGKNMLKTAQAVMEKHNGIFPTEKESLESLPGIGAYTASAIMAFAYDKKVPAIDTNVRRIIQILWPKKDITTTSQKLVTASSSGFIWNSAMMDLATQLRAGNPIEGALGETFFPKEIAQQFIPKQKKRAAPKKSPKDYKAIEVGIACIHQNGKYLIQSRPKGKSFVGFWEFPGGKREKEKVFEPALNEKFKKKLAWMFRFDPIFTKNCVPLKRTV